LLDYETEMHFCVFDSVSAAALVIFQHPFILFIIHSCAVVLSGIFLHLLSLRALNHNVRRLAGRQFFQLPVRGTAGLSMRASQSRRATESGNDG
jgi:hypothetical protein